MIGATQGPLLAVVMEPIPALILRDYSPRGIGLTELLKKKFIRMQADSAQTIGATQERFSAATLGPIHGRCDAQYDPD